MTFCGGQMNWGVVSMIDSIPLPSNCQQLADCCVIAINGCEMQWRIARVVLLVRPGTALEQSAENGAMATAGGIIKRCAAVIMGVVICPCGIVEGFMVVRRSNVQGRRACFVGNIRAGVVSQQNVDHGSKIVSGGVVKSSTSLQVRDID